MHDWFKSYGNLPICGVAPVKICAYSLCSRLVVFLYWEKLFIWLFFQTWEQTHFSQMNRVIQKKCFEFVFSGKGLNPQNLRAGTKPISWPFCKKICLFFLISWNTFWNANSIWVNINVNKNLIYFSYKICRKYKKMKKRRKKKKIRQKTYV